jgi:SAM-dependent methyltransferase
MAGVEMKNRDINGSYTSNDSPVDWIGNFWRLAVNASKHRSSMSAFVRIGIQQANDAIKAIESQGLPVHGLKMLEIGAGQLPRHMPVFDRDNEVLGLDHDVVPRGFDVVGYWRMWQRNGLKRVLKTLGRKAMGNDRAFKREFARQLGMPRIREPRLLSMDATRMDLPAESYDCVYSFDVFEHLPDVGAVVRECARILKPGGVFYTYLHPVTAEDGYHDLRILASQRVEIPFWAHLRPEHRAKAKPCAYINELRVSRYREIFTSELGQCAIATTPQPHHERLVEQLSILRAAGELDGYSDEELLCHRLVIVWRKPSAALTPVA